MNWKNLKLAQTMSPHPTRESELLLRFNPADRDQLVQLLEETFLHGAGELRIDLPENWLIFWKLRERESRLLLAHPQENEWVATVALESAHAQATLDSLKSLKAGDTFKISEIGQTGSVSNVEIAISLNE
jgi:hypothetical protein